MIGVAIFVYAKFDAYWPSLRSALNPSAAWQRLTGRPAAEAHAPSRLAWSADSTRVSLDCPAGLAECCDGTPEGAEGPGVEALCGEGRALLAKARWRGLLTGEAGKNPLRLEGRAFAGDGARGYELSAARGRDGSGAYSFQRAETRTWCEARRGCLTAPAPRAPLAGGRLTRGTGDGDGVWISAASAVRPTLAGRVSAVDSAAGGARVRLYHGEELYTTYEPLRLAAGIRPGAWVTPGTLLGTAPGGPKGYTVAMRVRRAGLQTDPFEFFSLRPPAEADEATVSDSLSVADTASGN